jgi:hypothetical protein
LVLGEAAWDVVFESWVLLACEAAKGSNERKEACTVDGSGGQRRHVKMWLEKIEHFREDNQSSISGPFFCIYMM